MKTILLAVPERRVARLVELSLARQQYAVEVATEHEARVAITGDLPDALVLDADMLGAEAVLAFLRSRPGGAEVPVIVVVCRARRDDVAGGWGAGADVVLAKPFNPMEMIAFAKGAHRARADAGRGVWYERCPA